MACPKQWQLHDSNEWCQLRKSRLWYFSTVQHAHVQLGLLVANAGTAEFCRQLHAASKSAAADAAATATVRPEQPVVSFLATKLRPAAATTTAAIAGQ